MVRMNEWRGRITWYFSNHPEESHMMSRVEQAIINALMKRVLPKMDSIWQAQKVPEFESALAILTIRDISQFRTSELYGRNCGRGTVAMVRKVFPIEVAKPIALPEYPDAFVTFLRAIAVACETLASSFEDKATERIAIQTTTAQLN